MEEINHCNPIDIIVTKIGMRYMRNKFFLSLFVSNYRKMMDIGGGPGVYPIQVVKEFPNMSAVVIDSKPVYQIAAQVRRLCINDSIEHFITS